MNEQFWLYRRLVDGWIYALAAKMGINPLDLFNSGKFTFQSSNQLGRILLLLWAFEQKEMPLNKPELSFKDLRIGERFYFLDHLLRQRKTLCVKLSPHTYWHSDAKPSRWVTLGVQVQDNRRWILRTSRKVYGPMIPA